MFVADADGEEPQKLTFSFLRGVEGDPGVLEWPAGADVVRKALSESLNAKNVAFLLGAGCSSYYAKEIDILGRVDEFDQAEACGETDDGSEVSSRLFAA